MISFRPLQGKIREVMGRPLPDLQAIARETWEIAPGGERYVPPAIFLPGQFERIKRTEFVDLEEVLTAFTGDFVSQEGPTLGYRLKNIDLVDGVLYAKNAQRHLQARQDPKPAYRVPSEVISGAMYETWLGNRWFGNWLVDDCLAHSLTASIGDTVTSNLRQDGHRARYEELLGIHPQRRRHVHFEELVMYDDAANNAGKTERSADMRRRILDGQDIDPVPGVFLLRGDSGDARIMVNERQIADQMAKEYGFVIIDPVTSTVDQIASACGNAAIVAGIEGSHLCHGLVMMPQHATLLVFQPPERTVAFLKMVTDRRNQRYAFVIGQGGSSNFCVAWDDIRRTVDLIR